MKQKPAVPGFFKLTYDKYLSLKTEEEKEKFWDDVINDKSVPTEDLERHLKEGLLLLSSQVESLSQKVKAHLVT